jgi:hypothetical protein
MVITRNLRAGSVHFIITLSRRNFLRKPSGAVTILSMARASRELERVQFCHGERIDPQC